MRVKELAFGYLQRLPGKQRFPGGQIVVLHLHTESRPTATHVTFVPPIWQLAAD